MTELGELGRAFSLEGAADDGVLLIHGWTGSPAHLRPIAERLHAAGLTVHAPRLAGHGTSMTHLGRSHRREWLGSARRGLMHLAEHADRVHVVGLSMGGLLGIVLAAEGAPVASLATINAPMRVRDRRAPLAALYRRSSKVDRWERAHPPDPDVAHYWVQYDGAPRRSVADLRALIRRARAGLDRVRCPALIVQSRADATVHPVSAEIIYRGLASRDKRLLWLQQAAHVSVLDVERTTIVEAVIDRIRSVAEAAPPE